MREVVIAGAIIWLIWELRWVLLALVIFDFIKWCFEEVGSGIAAAYHAIVPMLRSFATQSRIWLVFAFMAGGMLTQLARDWPKERSSPSKRNHIRLEPYFDDPAYGAPASRFLPGGPRSGQ